MNKELSIKRLRKDRAFREVLITEFVRSVTNVSCLIDALNYAIENRLEYFEKYEGKPLYEGDDDICDIVLPTFIRAWGMVFEKWPSIFSPMEIEDIKANSPWLNENAHKKFDERFELYQTLFDIDGFFDYFEDSLETTKGCLSGFEHIDKSLEHVTLIVDNYIAMLVTKTKASDNYQRDIRDAKLNKIV